MKNWCHYLYNYAPHQCYGSKEKVAVWAKMHEDRRAGEIASTR